MPIPRGQLEEPEIPMPLWATKRWRVDALVITEKQIILIKGAFVPDVGEASFIEHCIELIPQTPELEDYKDYPIKPILLTAVDGRKLREYYTARNIEVHFYCPDWVKNYLKTRPWQERTLPRDLR